MSYVSFQTCFWAETADWPMARRMLYLWLWSNDHVHGVTGIGHVAPSIIRAETGLSTRQLNCYRAELQESGSVWFFGNWYAVVARMKHTVYLPNGGLNEKLSAAARNYLLRSDIPRALVDALGGRYSTLFDTLSIPYAKGISPKPKPKPSPKPSTEAESDSCRADAQRGTDPVQELFDYHCAAMGANGKPRGWKLTTDRRRKIAARLKTSTLETLKTAVDNLSKSEFHMGGNDKGMTYNDPDFLYRSDAQVDKWANVERQVPLDDQGRPPKPPESDKGSWAWNQNERKWELRAWGR